MKELDILYYDSMIESVCENRRIMEMVTGSEMACTLLREGSGTSAEIAVLEQNIFKTIWEAIKKLIQKVIDYITTTIQIIKDRKVFKPKNKLIDAVKDKIKNISQAEKSQFKIDNANISDELFSNIGKMNQAKNRVQHVLNQAIDKTNSFLKVGKIVKGQFKNDPFFKQSEDMTDKLAITISDLSDTEYIKEKAKNVDYNDLVKLFDQYQKAEKTSDELVQDFKETMKSMRKNQKAMDSYVSNNKYEVVFRYDNEELQVFRKMIYSLTALMNSMVKFNVDMSLKAFRNQEAILRQFVEFKAVAKQPNDPQYRLAAAESADNFESEEQSYTEGFTFINESLFNPLPKEVKDLKEKLNNDCQQFKEDNKIETSGNMLDKMKQISSHGKKAKQDVSNAINKMIPKHSGKIYGHMITTTSNNGVDSYHMHDVISSYKDYILRISFYQTAGKHAMRVSNIKVVYDAKKCEIPQNIITDIMSSSGNIDRVNYSKTSVSISVYYGYDRRNVPNFEKFITKYGDKYDVKVSGGTIKIKSKKGE